MKLWSLCNLRDIRALRVDLKCDSEGNPIIKNGQVTVGELKGDQVTDGEHTVQFEAGVVIGLEVNGCTMTPDEVRGELEKAKAAADLLDRLGWCGASFP